MRPEPWWSEVAFRHGLLVAYAMDEDDPAGCRYVLVDPAKRRVGSLAFRETADEAICDEVTAQP